MTLFTLALFTIALFVLGWRLARPASWGEFSFPRLAFLPLPIIGLGLQFIALRWMSGAELVIGRIFLFVLSQILLMTFFVANSRFAPLRLLFVGFALNLLPILLNGGYMPITPETMASIHPGTSAASWQSGFVPAGSKDIVLRSDQARMWFLGDIFVLAPPFPLPTAFSIGDVFILIGYAWTLYQFTSSSGGTYETYRLGTARERGRGG